MFESRKETLLSLFSWGILQSSTMALQCNHVDQERPLIHLEKNQIILLNCSPVSQLYSEWTEMFENTVSENLSSVVSKAFLAEKESLVEGKIQSR